jgi:hypothetical protein
MNKNMQHPRYFTKSKTLLKRAKTKLPSLPIPPKARSWIHKAAKELLGQRLQGSPLLYGVLLAGYILVAIGFNGSRAANLAVSIQPEDSTVTAPATVITDVNASGGSAVMFGSGGCTASAPHIPDGPDGMGGCWPGPSNTGPNAPESSMTAYAGSCTITAPNTTIDSKVITCSPLDVGPSATGLLIKNSYIHGGVIQESGSASFTIQDSSIDNAILYPACSGSTSCSAGKYACGDPGNATTECGVGYKNFTILRTEIVNTNRAAYCESTCTIQDNYFHGTNLWPDQTNLAHASSVRNEQYLTLRHNSLGCDYQGPFPNTDLGCSADMSGYPDFVPIMHDMIDSNLFLANNAGIAYCTYGGSTKTKPYSNDPTNATYIVFQNNVFQGGADGKCGQYGPITDFDPSRTGNLWSNNKFDNGTSIPSQIY